MSVIYYLYDIKKEVLMEYLSEAPRKTDVCGEYDVIVCGGGIAGVAAALASSRCGAKTLLIEREYTLGGLATLGLVTIYLPLCDGMGNQVSYGITEELLKLSVKHGAAGRCPEKWLSEDYTREERQKSGRYEAQFDPNVFAVDCEKLLLGEGADILYGTLVCSAPVEDGRITHVVVENKSGRKAYRTKAVVDATGDADICALSGEDTAVYPQKNVLAAWYYSTEEGRNALHCLGWCEVPEADKPKDNVKTLVPDRFTGIDAEENSRFMFLSHDKAYTDFLSRGGVSKDRALTSLPGIPQLRMTRRLVGETTVTRELEGAYVKDSGGMFSDWRKAGPLFELPLSSLWGRKVQNLFAAGRCISADDSMWDVTRVIQVCALTGQAAGTLAALSPDKSDIQAVQSRLAEDKVRLHTSDI